jgi:hypothetical protein
MQSVVEEAEYVLTVLHRMKDEVAVNRELYDPDARKRIDEAIARVEDVLRQAQLMVCSGGRNPKAA